MTDDQRRMTADGLPTFVVRPSPFNDHDCQIGYLMSKVIEQFYDDNVQREWERLDRHRTEFAVTLRALREHLPRPPARLIDIGGGPGRYAIALAQQGYAVTLVDLSQSCLDFAQARAREAGVAFADVVRADAVDLTRVAAESYDAALLMGPLYHLIEAADRRKAANEAARVLRPGGLIFAAIITRYAPIRWAAKNAPTYISERREEFERIMITGMNPVRPGGGFTEAYFAHPSELVPLMQVGGFETIDLIACEGVVSMIEEQINELSDNVWEAWVNVNYQVGKDPSVHGTAEHLLYVGKKT
jgi:ubiquinone/menaquinone biosynthesis C-methylase UbiE